jgi:N12 class adenine-specific DNA methylase
MTEPPTLEERAKLDFASGQKKDGSFYVGPDGKLMQYKGGAGREVSKHGTPGGMSAGDREKVQHLIPIRDALREVFSADLDRDDARGAEARERLNAHYDAFVAAHGPINEAKFQYRRPTLTQQEEARLEAREEARSIGEYFDDGDFDPSNMLTAKAKVSEIAKARDAARQAATLAGRKFNEGSFDPADMADNVFESRPNIKPFMSDPESYRLRSIEGYDDATGKHWKKDIFDHSILKFEQEPEIKSAQDGVLWSYNKLGRFDIDAIAEKMDRDRSDLIAELGDSVYKVPNKGETYQTKDEYLSGDIVSKLEEARAAAATDADIRRNIPALEAAMPPPLPPSEISMILGMPWIPINTVKEFMGEHLGLGQVDVMHSDITGTWHVKGNPGGTGYHQWGTDDRDAFELLSDAMNRTPPRIYRWEGSGTDRKRVFDAVATQAAQDRVDALKAEFATWVGAEPDRADGLAKIYNDALNRSVLRQYDGSYLTTPGVAANWSWRPHQTRVVARIVQSGNTYMAHAVGAGKTSAMIGSGMEMRRLGLVRKPLYVVPNHMLAQFTKEFYEQYPTAKISVADEQRFHTDVRRQFVSNAAQDDLDAVIMTHSSFGKIPISDDFQDHLVREQIDMYEKALEELDGDENRIARGRVEKQKEKLEQKLSKKQEGQDQTLTFEELGADFLFVDEAHEFRKLSLATKQSGLKGISPEGSNKAWDLYTKVRYLDSQRPGRSVVFASGTPVTNTMGELYSLSRYMQPAALASRGLSHFDSWAQAFGDTKTGLEENAAGGYQPVTRFGQFVNLPELYKMVGETMDIVTPKELSQYVTRPALQGGERQFHLAPRTDALDAYQQELAGRMQAIKNRKGPPAKGDDILLSVINDGRHAAIDPRFVEQTQSDPRSKLNMMVQNVARIYRETGDKQFYDPNSGYQKESFRGPATQMIFANLGVNGRGPMGFPHISGSRKRCAVRACQPTRSPSSATTPVPLHGKTCSTT